MLVRRSRTRKQQQQQLLLLVSILLIGYGCAGRGYGGVSRELRVQTLAAASLLSGPSSCGTSSGSSGFHEHFVRAFIL